MARPKSNSTLGIPKKVEKRAFPKNLTKNLIKFNAGFIFGFILPNIILILHPLTQPGLTKNDSILVFITTALILIATCALTFVGRKKGFPALRIGFILGCVVVAVVFPVWMLK